MIICKDNKCMGCGACIDACKKKCIELIRDNDGFFKSLVDKEKCIECGICRKICPANNPNNNNKIQLAYKARKRDSKSAEKSTSGGIAAAISEYIICRDGVVVGSGFDENLYLKHSIATNLEQAEKFKGSKYLQSDTTGIYKRVKALLLEGKRVVFTGTPCQVSALKNFLGKEYDNLYLVDFVCHGVPSQKVFDKFLLSVCDNQRVTNISFRNKDNGYLGIERQKLQVRFSDKITESPFDTGVGLWFASSLSVRKSCYDCSFVSTNRCSDITLADYIGNDLTEEDIKCGMSTVFVNTEKGRELMRAIEYSVLIEERDCNSTIALYSRLNKKDRIPRCRKRFFIDINKLSYDELVQKYTLKRILPTAFERKMAYLFNRIKSKKS